MKKITSLMLAAALCLNLAACSGQNQTPQETAKATEAVKETAKSTEAQAPAGNTEAALENGLPEKPANFPSSTITCYVGFAAGGGVDTAARLLLKYAQEYIDVPLVVTNVTGASGAVAVTQALSGAADGTTLISIASGAMLGDITGAVTYDFNNDLQMVALQDNVPYALVFRTGDDRFSTPEEFIQYVKDHPGEITVSTSGVNNANYFAVKSFFEDNGMEVEIIPFDGSADAKTGFLGKHVDAFCETLLETIQMANSKDAVFVCTFGEKQYVDGVMTNEDLGISMNVTGTFRGYAYKAGTPEEVVDYLSAVFKLCIEDPAFIAECKALGLDTCLNYLNPEETGEFMKGQYDSYTELCKELGIAKQ